MFIINCPIEPINNRYSIQWNKWFRDHFMDLCRRSGGIGFHNTEVVMPDTDIGSENFLDPIGTNIYKSLQMAEVLRVLKHEYDLGERFFVVFMQDLWYPGLEKLKYIESMLPDVKINIYGILHAGSWDKFDRTYMKGFQEWSIPFESGWINLATKIFVATDFHKKMIENFIINKCSKEGIPPNLKNKIVVTGLPIYKNDLNPFDPNWKIPVLEKENLIAFPHRLVTEKGKDAISTLKAEIERRLPGFRLVITHEECKSKGEYYTMLARCKYSISLAMQETFGISMIESVFAGCIPIVPNSLSYQELFFSYFRSIGYNQPGRNASFIIDTLHSIEYYQDDFEVAKNMLALNDLALTSKCELAIPKMIEEILMSSFL